MSEGIEAFVRGLPKAELADLARESVRASFASGSTNGRLLAEIDAYVAAEADRADRTATALGPSSTGTKM